MKNKDLTKILEKIFKRKIRSNQNLFEIDNFDSLKFFEMISLIEIKIKKKIPNKLINEKNFKTMNSIKIILKKL